MNLIVVDNYEELSKVAAKEFAKVINEKPNAVLGLATGGSPVGMYKELIKMYENKELDFSKITTVNLDEYVGLNPEHEQSYRHFMNENLFKYINVDIKNTFVPNGLAKDLELECKEYDKKIEELGGIDIQLLGVGNNGHIAFNEPDEELSSGTHIITLTEAEAIKGLFSGKITTDNPASMLQMHRDVTVVVDKAAATLINE